MDTTRRRRPDDRTIYEIGSATKAHTGILLARSVVDGRIRLDDPAQQYLDAPYPKLAFDARQVRIVDLASHTAGLPKHVHAFLPGETPEQMLAAYGDESETPFLDDLRALRITERPGTRSCWPRMPMA